MPEEQARNAPKEPEADSSAGTDGGRGIGRRLAIPVVAGAAVAALTVAVRRGSGRVREAVASADVDELPEKASRALEAAKDRLGDLAGKVPPVADNLRELVPGAGEGSDGRAPVYRNAEEREAAQKEREARRAERRKRARA